MVRMRFKLCIKNRDKREQYEEAKKSFRQAKEIVGVIDLNE